ncbi:S26 family signal peptidase [Brevundimonas sp.]
MTTHRRSSTSQVALAMTMGLTAFAGVGLAWVHARDRDVPLFLVNESPSLPRGLYAVRRGAAPGPNAIVALPQPASVRGYLAGIGMPPDVLLIKRVAARQGDRICRSGAVMELGSRRVRLLEKDRQGVRLPTWEGCRTLGAGEVVVLGDTATSFDSRYFGPVKEQYITGVYREILRW